MKIRLGGLLFFILSLVFFSCDDDSECLEGRGIPLNHTLDLNNFSKISLSGDIELQIRQGKEQQVNLAAQAVIFEVINYGVKDGLLTIGYNKNVNCIKTPYGIWLSVQVPDLEEIIISGESEVVIYEEQEILLDYLKLLVSGVAKITLSEIVTDQVIEVSGIAEIHNFDCYSDHVKLSVSGSGDFEIYAGHTLDIVVNGEAKIRYKGDPQISRDISGSVDLIDAN